MADSLPMTLNMIANPCKTCYLGTKDVSAHVQFTVIETVGAHWDAYYGEYWSGAYLKVLSIEGLFGGVYAMNLLDNPGTPNHESWMFTYGMPGNVAFEAGGQQYNFFNDHAWNLLQGGSPGIDFGALQMPMSWSMTTEQLPAMQTLRISSPIAVPETPSWMLLMVGFVLAACRWKGIEVGEVE